MFFLVYIYLGYPLLLWLMVKIKPNNHRIQTDHCYQPIVTLIISAYNEEKVIEQKIHNSLDLEYPRDKFEIIVFSDGSNDRTEEIVKEFTEKGIKLFRFEGRKGKTYCQNEVVKIAKGEIIVFSDANSIYQADAIKKLMPYFADKKVGCVVGELRYGKKFKNDKANLVEGENIYWKYDKLLKLLESKISSVVTANGAIYALRKSVYIPLNDNINSDFIEILRLVAKGYRVIYEPEAITWESTAEDTNKELLRRKRIVISSVSSLLKEKEIHSLFNPFKNGMFSIQLLSHKVLRWFSAVLMLLSLALNFLLIGEGLIYDILMVGQVIFYLLALIGLICDNLCRRNAPKIPHTIYYLCLSCWAMLYGTIEALRGKEIITWETERFDDKNDRK